MKHIIFAVIAAAVLAVIGPSITPDNWQMGAQNAAASPTSMLRMRAGEVSQPSFNAR
jgi:uncharacterized protein YjeT (DUF2065 family)